MMPADPVLNSPDPVAAPIHQRFGLVGGLLLCGVLLALPAPGGLSVAGWHAAAIALLMAVWWMTEALPIAATSLVPLVAFPLLGVASITTAAAPYANPIVFLFMGGFLLAKGMERWHLHRRLALAIIGTIGTEPRRIVLGFMLAAALLSMGISNTATAVMMLPIAVSVVELARRDEVGTEGEDRRFALVLMLAVAYACSIGGLGTLIGTPTNALFAGFMQETYGVEISFAGWLAMGVPLVIMGLATLYFMLTWVIFPLRLPGIRGGKAFIQAQRASLGAMSRPERTVAVVFASVSLLWISRPLLSGALPGLSDTGIAIAGALLLFALPAGQGRRVLDWETARDLPWGVLLLFGGGLSLAAAIADTGLATWIGGRLALFGALPPWALVGLVVLVIVLLTELTSNTATAAAFLPVLAALAISTGTPPMLLLVPATVAASCAFMLPVATPPNAIVYGSGYVTIGEMARAGVWLNLTFLVLVTLFSVLIVPLLTGVALPEVALPPIAP